MSKIKDLLNKMESKNLSIDESSDLLLVVNSNKFNEEYSKYLKGSNKKGSDKFQLSMESLFSSTGIDSSDLLIILTGDRFKQFYKDNFINYDKSSIPDYQKLNQDLELIFED